MSNKIILELSKPISTRIHKIRQRMELASEVEVIARAISLYELLTHEVTQGNKVMVVDEEGEVVHEEVKIE